VDKKSRGRARSILKRREEKRFGISRGQHILFGVIEKIVTGSRGEKIKWGGGCDS